MSTWRAKALELFPELRPRILAMDHPLEIWREVEREFHAALRESDDDLAAHCLRYATWALHPAPQAKTLTEVSASAARLLYGNADDLHRWIDRQDFMQAQKGLRFHLGSQAYEEFEERFLAKTKKYPARKK